ncbi:MAG: hypothetical protein ACYCZV_16140 [Acidimicrobiales bacterium]
MRFLTLAQLEILAATIDARYREMVLTMAWAPSAPPFAASWARPPGSFQDQ